jgi:hypothetical protein
VLGPKFHPPKAERFPELEKRPYRRAGGFLAGGLAEGLAINCPSIICIMKGFAV